MTMTRKKCWICGRPVYSKISDICRPCERAWRVLVLKERGEENIDECYGCTWKGAPRDLFPCSECRGSVKEGPDWYSPAGEPLIYRNDDIPADEDAKDCSDLISRQAAIDVVEKYDFDFPQYMERFVTELRDAMKTDIIHDLKHLPSADRPTWEWIIEDAHTEHCSVCGCAFYISALFAVGGNDEPNYCPNCGARMYKGGEDE